MFKTSDTNLIIILNVVGVLIAYAMLAGSLYLSTEVPRATKGYWGMGVLLLTISLINVVKYRFDNRAMEDRISRIEAAKNEQILENLLSKD